MGESDDERRGGDRIPINDEFAHLDASPSGSSSAWVSDLSLGGVFVHTQELLPVGSMIELRFTILVDDPVVIEAFGKVVRHSRRPRGMGVAFAAISPDMSQRIEEVLARQRPLDSGAPLRLPEPRRQRPVATEPVAPAAKSAPAPEQRRVVLAQPAPVQGLGLRRVPKQDFENAVTAAFPRVNAPIASDDADDTTARFKPPPSPPQLAAKPAKAAPRPPKVAAKPSKAARKLPNEDALTRPFPTLPRKNDE